MAKTYADVVGEATQQVFDGLKQAQEAWLKAAEAAVDVVPTQPLFPFAPKGASVSEAIDAGFDVAQRTLDYQRRYSVQLASILTQGAARAASTAKA